MILSGKPGRPRMQGRARGGAGGHGHDGGDVSGGPQRGRAGLLPVLRPREPGDPKALRRPARRGLAGARGGGLAGAAG
eukprot:scaffold395198_cov24-Prasinocladus_malaysianus.AAC.1